jgi:hypothetical protein
MHTAADARAASAVLNLEAGDAVVVLPCTFDPGFEATYKLSFISQSPIKVRELKDERKEISIYGEWRADSAGGYPPSTADSCVLSVTAAPAAFLLSCACSSRADAVPSSTRPGA